jgi:hypothetical protein
LIWAAKTWVADKNIVIAIREIGTSILAQGGVVGGGSQVAPVGMRQRKEADGRVAAAVGLCQQRTRTQADVAIKIAEL